MIFTSHFQMSYIDMSAIHLSLSNTIYPFQLKLPDYFDITYVFVCILVIIYTQRSENLVCYQF